MIELVKLLVKISKLVQSCIYIRVHLQAILAAGGVSAAFETCEDEGRLIWHKWEYQIYHNTYRIFAHIRRTFFGQKWAKIGGCVLYVN